MVLYFIQDGLFPKYVDFAVFYFLLFCFDLEITTPRSEKVY